jgi:VanZ family protein
VRSSKYWLPPVIWMAVIFWFSTDTFSAAHTGSILEPILRHLYPAISQTQVDTAHFLARKGAHFCSYAVLALLLFRAMGAGAELSWRWSWALASFVILAAYALLDEYHQSFSPERTASIYDSLLDMTGGLAALSARWAGSYQSARARRPATGQVK